jgi:hypothetical protein
MNLTTSIMPYQIIKRVEINKDHIETGAVKHYFGSQQLSKPTELQIVQITGDPGFYLLYFDSNGNELTDTYHEKLEDAIEQATDEFTVKSEDWHS